MSDGRLAAIDIGSDTIHMIVVQRHRGNRLKHIREKSRLVELGMLEEQKGSLPDYVQGSIRRTLESFIRQAREAGASKILVAATAALRDDPRRRTIATRLSRAVGYPYASSPDGGRLSLDFSRPAMIYGLLESRSLSTVAAHLPRSLSARAVVRVKRSPCRRALRNFRFYLKATLPDF